MNEPVAEEVLDPAARHRRLQRMLYREFLAEPNLYQDAGLERLPVQLGALLGCAPPDAIYRLAASTFVDEVDERQLARMLRVQDMELVSRTAAAVATDLKHPDVSYERAIRTALCFAVSDLKAHAFAALRAAAVKKPEWARHHYLYGLLTGLMGNHVRAIRELNFALEREPYDDARQRIRAAIALIDPVKASYPGR